MDVLFELRAALKAAFLPPGIFLMLLAAGVGLCWRNSRAGRRVGVGVWLATGALTALIVTSLPAFVMLASRGLELQHAPLTSGQLEQLVSQKQVQAIVVLGGGLRLGALEEPDRTALSRYSLERLSYAAKLQRASGLPMLVSGGLVAPAIVSEAQVMARVLREHFGLQATWLEDRSTTTRENAAFSSDQLKKQGVASVVLVSSASHMERAVTEFRRHGIKVIPAPSGYSSEAPLLWRSFVPNAAAAERFGMLVHEWVGILWYKYLAS